MSGIFFGVIIIIVIAILFNLAKEIAKLVLTLFLSAIVLMVIFCWTTEDYIDLFALDKVIAVETHANFYRTLDKWDDWREENGLLLFQKQTK